MGKRKSAAAATSSTEALRATLKSQYHGALAMLQQAIDLCPERAWSSSEHANAAFQYFDLFSHQENRTAKIKLMTVTG